MVVCSSAQTEGIITSRVSEPGRHSTSPGSEIALALSTKYSYLFAICDFQKVTALI